MFSLICCPVINSKVMWASDLTDAAAASESAAALTEVIIIPVWEWRTASDAVQVIQTAIPRELPQRRKTTEDRKGKGVTERREQAGDERTVR